MPNQDLDRACAAERSGPKKFRISLGRDLRPNRRSGCPSRAPARNSARLPSPAPCSRATGPSPGAAQSTTGTISGRVTDPQGLPLPGVTVSGRFPDQGDARLSISGRSAARGTLRITRDGVITGRLAGRRVRLTPRAQAAAARPKPFELPHPDLVAAGR